MGQAASGRWVSGGAVNRGPKSQQIFVSWTEIGIRSTWLLSGGICRHKDLRKITGKSFAEVPSHEVVMVTVKP